MLNPLVILDNGPVAANNVTNLPDNWKVLHPLGETSDETELGLGVGGLHTAMQGLVDHFDSTNEPILSLVRMACVNDHTVERNLLLTVWNSLSKLHVVHFTSLLKALVVVVCNLVVYNHIFN